MEAHDLPNWVQGFLTLGTIVGAILAGLFGYKRREEKLSQPKGDAVVVSATIADGSAMRDLVHEMRENTSATRESIIEQRRTTDEIRTLSNCVVAIRGQLDRYESYRKAHGASD